MDDQSCLWIKNLQFGIGQILIFQIRSQCKVGLFCSNARAEVKCDARSSDEKHSKFNAESNGLFLFSLI
jgi:hypothetical protein